jgi:hypothetical protein
MDEIDTAAVRWNFERSAVQDKDRTILALCAALDAARRWKAEALAALNGWESVWRALGQPGPLGVPKWEACIAEVARLTEQARLREIDCSNLMTENAEKDVLIGMMRDDNNAVHDTAVFHAERAEAAEARIAAALALCDEWERSQPGDIARPYAAGRVRAALGGGK